MISPVLEAKVFITGTHHTLNRTPVCIFEEFLVSYIKIIGKYFPISVDYLETKIQCCCFQKQDPNLNFRTRIQYVDLDRLHKKLLKEAKEVVNFLFRKILELRIVRIAIV